MRRKEEGMGDADERGEYFSCDTSTFMILRRRRNRNERHEECKDQEDEEEKEDGDRKERAVAHESKTVAVYGRILYGITHRRGLRRYYYLSCQ